MSKHDQFTIAVTWDVEDVLMVRDDLRWEQAHIVLNYVRVNHDATVGINWDVLEAAASALYPRAD